MRHRHHLLKTIGRRVKSLREKAGLTQEEAAARSGIDPKHLQKIERGATNPTILTLVRIAGSLRTSPDRLLRA